jgi:elongation factor P--beta-lysine ligase
MISISDKIIKISDTLTNFIYFFKEGQATCCVHSTDPALKQLFELWFKSLELAKEPVTKAFPPRLFEPLASSWLQSSPEQAHRKLPLRL